MCRFKRYILIFFFIFVTISNNVLASSKIVDRSYTYVQVGVGVDLHTNLFISLKSFDGQKKIWVTNNYTLTGHGDINPFVSFGYYLNSSDLALELEYGVHTVYEKTINGQSTNTQEKEKAYATMNYVLINARKNLFTIFSNKNIFFGKLGFGASMVNNITLNKSAAVNIPNPLIQLGLGYTRQINNYIDLDLEYRYKINLSKREQVSNGIKQIYRLQAQTLVASVRFKI